MLKSIVTVFIVAAISVFAAICIAEARQCTTTCSTYGSQTTCQQNCW